MSYDSTTILIINYICISASIIHHGSLPFHTSASAKVALCNFKADLSLGTLTYRLSVGSETPTYPKRPAPQASRSERYSCSQHLLRSTWSEHQNQIMIRLLDENSKNDGLSVFGNDVTNRFGPCLLLQIPLWDLFPKKNSPLTRCSKTLDQMKPWKNIILKLFLTCCCLCTTHCCEKTSQTGIISIVGDVTVEVAPFQKLC